MKWSFYHIKQRERREKERIEMQLALFKDFWFSCMQFVSTAMLITQSCGFTFFFYLALTKNSWSWNLISNMLLINSALKLSAFCITSNLNQIWATCADCGHLTCVLWIHMRRVEAKVDEEGNRHSELEPFHHIGRLLAVQGRGHVAPQDHALSGACRHKPGLLSHSVGTWTGKVEQHFSLNKTVYSQMRHQCGYNDSCRQNRKMAGKKTLTWLKSNLIV